MSTWSFAEWAALVLGVALVLTVVVAAVWLHYRGLELRKARDLAAELKRSADKEEEKDRLHALPDLGPLLHGSRRASDR